MTPTPTAVPKTVGELLQNPDIPGFKFADATLGKLLSEFYTVAFYLVTFLAFFWLVWGAFQYIFAGGDKQKLAEARNRIIWALVGLLIVSIAFLVAQFAQQIIYRGERTPIL